MEHIQSIISWNIANSNGITGKKSDDSDFVKIIEKHSIICLQETNDEVCVPGYRSFSDLRDNSNSGGVTILVKKQLAIRCNMIKLSANITRSLNIVVLKVSGNQDFYIVNFYISPANSKLCKTSSDSQINFDIVHEVINKLKNECSIIVCGDFNARIGNDTGIDEEDNSQDS